MQAQHAAAIGDVPRRAPSPCFGSVMSLLLLVGDRAAAATGGTRVLTARAQVPVVTQTTVHTHLLHALKVVTQLCLNVVRQNLRVLAGGEILLPVEEP